MTFNTGIVVPTLGTRPDFLRECLTSIRNAGDCFIAIVGPEDRIRKLNLESNLFDALVPDQGLGLPSAINLAIRSLPSQCIYASWLGDDDMLTSGSIELTGAALAGDLNIAAVYGICHYMDVQGKVFWTNKFGQLAVPLLSVGPNKIPQPGSLFRRSLFEQMGGLDTSLGWAFDQDMFARLSKHGRIVFINLPVANFRWHSESLSAGSSKKSLMESARVRFKNANLVTKGLLLFLEPLHQLLASLAGSSLNRRVKEVD
jgi:GT2 family glycosyltransferase